MVVAGLLAGYSPTSPGQQFRPPLYENDPRLLILREFFEERESPIGHLAKEFLLAADRHDLDWRLLPAIAVVESGGGKQYRHNNLFGWDNGEGQFGSLKEGIHHVAERLATSNLYRDKDLDELLRTYNPYVNYPLRVKYVMTRICRTPWAPTRCLN
ncbi:MAG: hypothetical protein RMK57_03225 [Bryobacterales bacterium]|nr:hypothetical protein [Bryobacteraceae bacterium]MDW8353519.1 hypothetical protein [Bryobacterales bacterium]